MLQTPKTSDGNNEGSAAADVEEWREALIQEERRQKEAALFHLDILQKNYNELLLKYGEAKNIIDRQRFRSPDTSYGRHTTNDASSLSSLSEELTHEVDHDNEDDESRSEGNPLRNVIKLNQALQPEGEFLNDDRESPSTSRGCLNPVGGDVEKHQHEFVDCLTCSCPQPTSKRCIDSERRATDGLIMTTCPRRVSTSTRSAITTAVKSMTDKDNARLQAFSLKDKISKATLQDGTTAEAERAGPLNYLRFQLQSLRNEVQRLRATGIDVSSLDNLVSNLDLSINRCDDDDEEWVSTSSSGNSSVSKVRIEFSNDCNGFQEFKRDFNEKLVAIKSIMDTRGIKKRDDHHSPRDAARTQEHDLLRSDTENTTRWLPFLGLPQSNAPSPPEMRQTETKRRTGNKETAGNESRRGRRRCKTKDTASETSLHESERTIYRR